MNPLGDKTPPVSSRLVASLIRACFLLLGSLVSASVLLGGAAEAQPKVSHLSLAKVVSTPSAASDLCSRYEWACAGYKTDESHLGDLHSLAKKVNRHINQRVHSVDDIVQYRERDYWTLPSRRGGDCEDFALLKKYELMRTGISPARLLIAMVMGKRVGAHAVLILRLEHGDFVLDSLNNSIKPWFKTGYTFLRVQNPESPDTWVSVSSAG